MKSTVTKRAVDFSTPDHSVGGSAANDCIRPSKRSCSEKKDLEETKSASQKVCTLALASILHRSDLFDCQILTFTFICP